MFRACSPYVLALVFVCPPFLTQHASLVLSECRAAKVKVWHQHTPAQYDKAQLKQAVISSEGTLRLSRQLRPLAGLDAEHVWDMAEDRDGNLYVATGDEGKIYKIAADGKPVV